MGPKRIIVEIVKIVYLEKKIINTLGSENQDERLTITIHVSFNKG
jgi:hypothetical protein